MRPDPGRDLLEARLAAMTRDERALLSTELRVRGFALAWDQLDRAGPMGPVEQALFLIDRLYPEMPAVHRASIARQLEAQHAAGTWHGPERPADAIASASGGVGGGEGRG